jgi:hypothetical protein
MTGDGEPSMAETNNAGRHAQSGNINWWLWDLTMLDDIKELQQEYLQFIIKYISCPTGYI